MLIEERLKELKDKINEKVPRGITVTQVEFEGPELVIYTDDPKRFADEADLIKILARDLRKRIVVRPTILEDPEKAYNDIKAVVPDTAGITDIFFDPAIGFFKRQLNFILNITATARASAGTAAAAEAFKFSTEHAA